jgi:hypothetical protein
LSPIFRPKYFVYLIFSGIIFILLGWYLLGAVFLFQPKKIDGSIPHFDYEIQYTESGYSPNLLIVPLGSAVGFKNTTNIPMWTASDPHPLHSDFSVFDAQKDYLSKETYIFEFTSLGTFSFHNHEKSIHRGIVRVIDPANPLPGIDKTKEGQREIRDKFLSLLNESDPNSIFNVIDAIEADSILSRDCHDMAHDIGHQAYELFGFSAAMTFNNPDRLSHTSADDICAGGYMHGILEGLFLNRPELKSHPEIICSSVPDVNRDSCFHGVGHGLMFVNKRDIPTSLTSCRSLKLNTDIYRCFEGVWMEMFWGSTNHAGSSTLGWTLEQPLAACVNAREDEKPTCFLYAHLGYLRTHPRDFVGAIDLCTKNELVETDVQFCLKGVGITMMKHFTSHHLERSEKLVEGLDYEKKYAYYQGVIGYALLSNVSRPSIKNFCSLLRNDKEICNTVLKNNIE